MKKHKADKRTIRHNREPVVVEAPAKPKIKLLPAPKPSNVRKAKTAIYKLIADNGVNRYIKDRARTDRVVEKVLVKFEIKGTSSENFWRLHFICLLIAESKVFI